MFKICRIAIVIAVILGLSQIAGANGNSAIEAWNDVCGQYKFEPYPQGPTETFHDAYMGLNFNADFAAIMNSISQVLSVRCPDIGGNDLINFQLENWDI